MANDSKNPQQGQTGSQSGKPRQSEQTQPTGPQQGGGQQGSNQGTEERKKNL